MEDKDLQRALAAIVVSFIILIGYQYFFVKKQPVKTPEMPRQEQAVEPGDRNVGEPEPDAGRSVAPVSPPTVLPAVEKIVTVETPLYIAEVSSRGAAVRKWQLRKYHDLRGLPVVLTRPGADIPPLAIGAGSGYDLSRVYFETEGGDLKLDDARPEGSLTFVYRAGEVSVRRTLTFHADTYRVDVSDTVQGLGTFWVTLGENFGITGAAGYGSHIGPVTLMGTDRKEYKPEKVRTPLFLTPRDLKWVALEDKYFFSSLVPGSEVLGIKVWSVEDSSLVAYKFPAGESRYVMYAGPKVIDELRPLGYGLEHIVDFGFWSFIARPIFWLLKFINKYIGNYGWSIIILTIVLRIPFIPLLNKGQKSMKKMQAIQPKMAEIKEKYKKDPQKMQKEMMELYRKYKVNPMGGCLPMLIQIPVFFALYKVLLVAIEMRQAPFMLWIKDLSAKDPYYVLPIVMGITMFIQQKMTPTSGDPKQAKIMMFMPVIFTFMFLNFSSGLVLYWLMSNVLSIIQQFFVNRKVAAEEAGTAS